MYIRRGFRKVHGAGVYLEWIGERRVRYGGAEIVSGCCRLGMTGLETAGAVASLVMARVTTATLIALIVYTIETHKLRLEAQRQNENSMMPVVIIQSGYFPPHERFNGLVVRNLGAGAAFNIRVKSIEILGNPATFEYPRTLAPGQVEFVAISGLREAKMGPSGSYDDGKIHGAGDLLRSLKSIPDTKNTEGVITYTSAGGKQYRTTMTFNHESVDPESFIVSNSVLGI